MEVGDKSLHENLYWRNIEEAALAKTPLHLES